MERAISHSGGEAGRWNLSPLLFPPPLDARCKTDSAFFHPPSIRGGGGGGGGGGRVAEIPLGIHGKEKPRRLLRRFQLSSFL